VGLLIIQVFLGVTSCQLTWIYQSTQRNIPNHLNIQTLFYMYRKKQYIYVWPVSKGTL